MQLEIPSIWQIKLGDFLTEKTKRIEKSFTTQQL
jgi:hypothetical protein